MLSATVFFTCAFFSLLIAYFTIDAKTAREKAIVTAWAILPSFTAAYGVDATGEAWAAMRGFIGPWIGVAVWQLYMKYKVKQNYWEILTPGDVEVLEGETTTTGRGQGLDSIGGD